MPTVGRFVTVCLLAPACAGLDCLTPGVPLPVGDLLPGGAAARVTLRIVNNAGVEAIVDSTFYSSTSEVRRTTRVLASAGSESSETVLATFAERISIMARESLTGDVLAQAELLVHQDFAPGELVVFTIPPKDVPPAQNPAPIADAGPDQAVVVGARVTLDGSGSRDPLGEPIEFQWRQIAGPVSITIDDPTAEQTFFLAPHVDTPVTFEVELTVSDGETGASDTAAITVLPDCDGNGVADADDIRNGAADCQGDGIPDVCQLIPDCDGNGVPDGCDPDCDGNAMPDACDIATEPALDCDGNGAIDACEIAAGSASDCDGNGRPDSCDIASCKGDPACGDCNGNGIPDGCELVANDCNGNGIPDECDPEARDVGGLVAALLPRESKSRPPKGETACHFDANGDNRIDGADIAPYIERMLSLPAGP